MGKIVVDFATIETTKGPRSVTAVVNYEKRYRDVPDLYTVKGKTEAEAIEKARAWLAKRTAKKMLICCGICKNGVEQKQTEVKGKPYKYELACGSCGGITYRGTTKLEWA